MEIIHMLNAAIENSYLVVSLSGSLPDYVNRDLIKTRSL